jgi:hypothetical protein
MVTEMRKVILTRINALTQLYPAYRNNVVSPGMSNVKVPASFK